MPIFSAGSASVSIVPDFSGAQRAIGEWFARQSDVKVKVTPDLANGDVARTEAELNAMHGTAKVEVDRNVLTSSIGTAIAEAMSRSGLDRLGGLLAAAVGPTIVTAIGGAFVELAAAASQAVGILALAPAALAAIAVPAAVVAFSVQGMGAAFKALDTGNATQIAKTMGQLTPAAQQLVLQIHALRPAWDSLKLDVQSALFAGVGSAVSNLAGVALPILHTGLVQVAGAMNTGLLATMTALQGQGANFTTLFGNIAGAIRVSAAAAAPLIQAFMTLAAVGSQFLPVLAAGFVNVANRFNDWIQHMAATGQLVTLIQNAINVLVQLGRIAINVASIVVGVFSAALPYGNLLIALLVRVTGGLATFVHSADGQTALRSFFSGISTALAAVLPALANLVEAVVTAVLPAIGQLAALLAPIAATLLNQLATALRAVGAILPPVAQVIAALVAAMAPLIPVVSQIITTLLPPLVVLFSQLAPIISQVAQIVGQALLAAVRAVAPVLPQIGAAFIGILNAVLPLLPALLQIVERLLPPLLAVVTALVPIVRSAVSVFAGIAGVFLQIASATVLPLVVFLLNTLAAILRVLSPVLGPLAGIVLAIVGAVKLWTIAQGLLDIALDANPIGLIAVAIVALIGVIGLIVTHLNVLRDVFTTVVDWVVAHWRILVGAIPGLGPVILAIVAVVQNFGAIWQTVVNAMLTTWRVASVALQAGWSATWNLLSSTAQSAWRAISAFLVGALNGFLGFWSGLWSAVSNFFSTVWSGISSFAVRTWSGINAFLVAGLNAFFGFWRNIWDSLFSFFQNLWNSLSSFTRNTWNALSAFLVAGLDAFFGFWRNLWNSLFSFFQNLWNSLSSFTRNTWNALSAFLVAGLDAFFGFWRNLWNNASAFFSNTWTTIRTTAVSTWNAISGFLDSALNNFSRFWSSVWSNIRNVVVDIWRTMINGIRSAWDTLVGIVEAPVRFVVNTVVNGFIRGVDGVMSFLHLPWHIPTIHLGFAEGGFTGDGIFGTGGKYDPAGVVHAREFVVNQEQTARHLPLLQAINSGVQGFADGGLVGGLPSFAEGGLVGQIVGLFTDPVGTTVNFVKSLIGNGAGRGPFADMVTGIPIEMARQMGGWIGTEIKKGIGAALGAGGALASTITHALGSALNSVLNFFGFGSNTAGFSGSGGVARWTGDVQAVLNMLHRGTGETGAVLRRIAFESGGNPNAINLTDSNARAGHPSQGLMQVIPSTFFAYRNPALSGSIVDPLANIYAGSNYALHRYGSLAAIDPLVRPRGYDTGGWLPPGYNAVYNGTGGFEAVLNQAQQSALVGAVTGRLGAVPVWHFYLGDREITDLVDARVSYHTDRTARTVRSGS